MRVDLMYSPSLRAQDIKAAILEDILRLGKKGGLKSFEQVGHILICLPGNIVNVRHEMQIYYRV